MAFGTILRTRHFSILRLRIYSLFVDLQEEVSHYFVTVGRDCHCLAVGGHDPCHFLPGSLGQVSRTLLRKHVAVDVGRHVFAALNAAELGLCGAFWVGRLLQCCTATSTRATGSFWKSASYYYRDSSFVLPAVTSVLLLAQVFSIAPRLFLRAKARIVEGFNDSSIDAQLSDPEKLALNDISHQVKSSKLPSPKWHRIYALLELVKVVCLQAFAVIQWKSIP